MLRQPVALRKWMSSVVSEVSTTDDLRDYFFALVESLEERLLGEEVLLCEVRGEVSSFARLNHACVGQIGDVRHQRVTIDLIHRQKHALSSVDLAGDREIDLSRVRSLMEQVREIRSHCPDDPYLSYNTAACSGEFAEVSKLPDPVDMVGTIVDAAQSEDLVGIVASGAQYRGFANSLGQRNWHSTHSFNFDWSLFSEDDRAVKSSYAGKTWAVQEVRQRIAASVEMLATVRRPPKVLRPGRYRVYLAPAAMYEVVQMLSWGGFSVRGLETKSTPFLRMHESGARLSERVTLSENIAAGTAPSFESSGFPRPEQTTLIAAGRYEGSLVSPRSEKEFGVPTNGANAAESPVALDMRGGDLDRDTIAESLHTGLLVSNLWYLNFSDRAAGRMTGMTRFATQWVENGRVQGPIEVMRFDDTVYRMLGENLIGLTRQRDWIMDPDTYDWRSTNSARLPGALIDDFALTL